MKNLFITREFLAGYMKSRNISTTKLKKVELIAFIVALFLSLPMITALLLIIFELGNY